MELTQRLAWRGRSIAWDRIGSGPAVVLCHGTPFSSAVWADFAEALSSEFTVYLWDMAGYGQSSMDPDHDVDLGTQGELLADLLIAWDLKSPRVVAHDFGGAVSLRAHLLHMASYHSLALVDVVAVRPWGSPYFRLVGDNADVFAAQPPAMHRAILEAYISGASHQGLSPKQLNALTAPWLTSEGQPAFYRQIAQADQRFTDEVQDLYADIAIPVKVIWGRDDAWVSSDIGAEIAGLIPGAELEIIDGAGHLIQLDAPVHLAMALHRWLA